MVKLSIKYQLFFIILLTTSLIVSGMYFFVHTSFKQGFIRLAEERRQVFISQLIAGIADEYQHVGNWNNLRNNSDRWTAIVQESLPTGIPKWHVGLTRSVEI